MRALVWLSVVSAAVSAATLPASQQVAFQATSTSQPMDIVDIMAYEAQQKNIPLNAALEPVEPQQNFRGSWTWTPCDFADAAVSVYSIEVSPDPPIKGQNVTIRGVGDVHTEITVRIAHSQPGGCHAGCASAPRPPTSICAKVGSV